MEKRHVIHTFLPIIDNECKILILGSVPSVKSMQAQFYYAHKHNRFWKIISEIIEVDLTNLPPELKTKELLKHHIGIYDSVFECDIMGSSDNRIENIIHANIKELIKDTQITHIFANGQKAYVELLCGNSWTKEIATKLPSTSAANAQFTFLKLLNCWEVMKNYI